MHVCNGFNMSKYVFLVLLINKNEMDEDFKKKAILCVLGTFGQEGAKLDTLSGNH